MVRPLSTSRKILSQKVLYQRGRDGAKMMFRPAKRSRMFLDIVDQIQEHILSGKLRVGEMLPSERDLQELFEVSRGTIREALRVLEQKGLIEIKLGVTGGAVVRSASVDKVSESLALLIRHQKISLAHLAEFREELEGDIASLAAERADERQIETLENILEEASQYVKAGPESAEDFLEVDKRFHLALARVTGNPIFEAVERIVHENIISYYESFLEMGEKRIRENYEDLKLLVAAMKKNSKEEARMLARRHVARFTTYMAERKG